MDAPRGLPSTHMPLFPLHTVLCPGICLPLHIFEERYRLMIGHCLADETPFGVVLIREGREAGGGPVALARVGTVAEIRKAGRYDDGRFDILAVGTQRFILDDVLTDMEPYLVGRVTLLTETLGDRTRARALASRVSRRFVEYLDLIKPAEGEDAEELEIRVEVDVEPDDAELGDHVTDEAGAADWSPDTASRRRGTPGRVALSDDPSVLSHLLSGILQVEHARRQVLLEAPTAESRLRELDRLLDREIPLLSRRLRHYLPDPRLASLRRN
jgi:Lon protease-like protein